MNWISSNPQHSEDDMISVIAVWDVYQVGQNWNMKNVLWMPKMKFVEWDQIVVTETWETNGMPNMVINVLRDWEKIKDLDNPTQILTKGYNSRLFLIQFWPITDVKEVLLTTLKQVDWLLASEV